MAWERLIPQNVGGGRKRKARRARLEESGQFYVTHALAEEMGFPDRVLVDVDFGGGRIKLTPAMPDDRGAFAFSGGGNSSYRVRMRAAVTRSEGALVGDFAAAKSAHGMIFTKLRKGEE